MGEVISPLTYFLRHQKCPLPSGTPSKSGREILGRVVGSQGWGPARVHASRWAWSISGAGPLGPRPRNLLCDWACHLPTTPPLPVRLGQTGGPQSMVAAEPRCHRARWGSGGLWLPSSCLEVAGHMLPKALGRGSAVRPGEPHVWFHLLQKRLDSWTRSYTRVVIARVSTDREAHSQCITRDWGPGGWPAVDPAFNASITIVIGAQTENAPNGSVLNKGQAPALRSSMDSPGIPGISLGLPASPHSPFTAQPHLLGAPHLCSPRALWHQASFSVRSRGRVLAGGVRAAICPAHSPAGALGLFSVWGYNGGPPPF